MKTHCVYPASCVPPSGLMYWCTVQRSSEEPQAKKEKGKEKVGLKNGQYDQGQAVSQSDERIYSNWEDLCKAPGAEPVLVSFLSGPSTPPSPPPPPPARGHMKTLARVHFSAAEGNTQTRQRRQTVNESVCVCRQFTKSVYNVTSH